MKKKFYIGTYKNGQDFAKIVDDFGHEKKENAINELVKMFNKTDFDPEDGGFGMSENEVREHLHFSEDTNNWGIFELSEDEKTGKLEHAITNIWGSRNFKSNQL